ncbi:MAG TPA: hypothetical protein VH595_01440 [Verrucomicrobiae bacterium]|jgi:hypothetical protein|nr:hypothetical protein [Verrucomicrobiae bacterium]
MFSSADGQIEFYNNAAEAMRIRDGNVGIGITNPAVPLQVNGTVMLGNGGSNYAASAQENLRIVRGIITPTEPFTLGLASPLNRTPWVSAP